MKDPAARDSLDGFLRDIDKRIARQERHTHHSVGEVVPTGEMIVSADRNNATRFGSDAGIYTREIVAKADAPTAFDFGGLLLVGSVWVDVSGGAPIRVCDDFERADGPIGPSWITGHAESPGGTTGYVVVDFQIIDGAAVNPDYDIGTPETLVGSALTAGGGPGDHFVEIVAANQWQAMTAIGNGGLVVEGQWYLYVKANATDKSCYVAYVFPYTGDYLPGSLPVGGDTNRANWGGVVGVVFYQMSPLGDLYGWDDNSFYLQPFPWQDDPEVTYRFEVAQSGGADVLSFYVDGTLLHTSTVPDVGSSPGSSVDLLPHPTGDKVGWMVDWHETFYLGDDPEPNDGAWQTLSVCVPYDFLSP